MREFLRRWLRPAELRAVFEGYLEVCEETCLSESWPWRGGSGGVVGPCVPSKGQYCPVDEGAVEGGEQGLNANVFASAKALFVQHRF